MKSIFLLFFVFFLSFGGYFWYSQTHISSQYEKILSSALEKYGKAPAKNEEVLFVREEILSYSHSQNSSQNTFRNQNSSQNSFGNQNFGEYGISMYQNNNSLAGENLSSFEESGRKDFSTLQKNISSTVSRNTYSLKSSLPGNSFQDGDISWNSSSCRGIFYDPCIVLGEETPASGEMNFGSENFLPEDQDGFFNL